MTLAATDPAIDSPIGLAWHAIYGVAEQLTGMVGLTPPQVLLGAALIVCISISVQLVLNLSGRQGWTLDDQGPDPE